MSFTLDLGNLLVHLKLGKTDWDKTIREVESSLDRTARKLSQVGRQLSFRVTAPLTAIGTALIRNSLIMESAFAGVRKTVDATEEQFTSLKAGFDEMARTIPLSVQEIYGIGEAAGQLGISLPNLQKFTEAMAALGVATNMTAQEAAMSLARFTNIMQMPEQDVDRLGSVIVELGNNLATTEREITEMAVRMAGAGKIVNMTEAEVMGLAAALSSVGMEAEAGGTAINRIILDMYNAVQSGSKELKIFAMTAGQSIDEFSQSFRRNSADAFASFVEGLGRLHKAGANVQQVLEAVGMDNVRVTRALLSAAGAGDLLRNSLEMGNRAWKENTALVEEASKRYATQESRLRALLNRMKLSVEGLGNILAGRLLTFTEKYVDPLIAGFQGLSANTQNLIVDFGVLAALAGPVALGFGLGIKALLAFKGAILATVGSATLLQSALAGVFVAVAGYKLGSYLYNEFESVAVAATKVAGVLWKAWETVKYTMSQGIVYLRAGWNKFRGWWMNMAADIAAKATQLLQHLEAAASKASGTVVNLGSMDAQKLYIAMRKAAKASMQSFNAEIEEGRTEYQQQLNAIEQATTEALAEIQRKFAGSGNGSGDALNAANLINNTVDSTNKKVEASLAKDKELIDSLNESLGMSADQIEAYRSILSELGPVTKELYEFQKKHVERIAKGYEEQGVNLQLVNRWLEHQNQLLDIAAGKVGSMTEQLKAAAAELKLQAEQAGGPWYQFAMEVPSLMENGLMRILQAGRSWKEQMKSFIQEVAWEFVRMQAIRPLAQELGQLLPSLVTSIGGSIGAGGGNIGNQFDPGPSLGGLAEGGIAWRPTVAALAEKGKPELVTPLDQIDKLGFGGGETKELLREILRAIKQKAIVNPVVVDRREDVVTAMSKDVYRRGRLQSMMG